MNAWNWSHPNNRHSYRRIVAALTILTMLLACLISDLLPNTTYADVLQYGDTCEPTQVTIGELNATTNTPDTGIATFVGGNMYIGKPNNLTKTTYGSDNQENTIEPNTANANEFSSSYAVEAEGTTLVAGKMINSSLKRSWDSHGFRFGTVGFGANFRPAEGSTSLAIGGNGNLQLTDRNHNPTSVLAYGLKARENRTTAAGWTGIYDNNDAGPSYNMQINNNNIKAWPAISGTPNAALETYTDAASYINWDSTNALANVTIQGSSRTDYTNFLEDTVRKDSTLLAHQNPKEGASVTIETAQYATEGKIGSPSVSGEGEIYGTVFQTQYNKFNNDNRVPSYPVQYNNNSSSRTDRLITFNGTRSDTEVFEISGTNLNMTDGSYIGTAFNFTNVKDDARIVVNITGSDPITFRNSWRFFWNGKDISKGYNNAAKENIKNAYSKAASHITWNFTETSYLTILGGTSAYDYNKRQPVDDPAAAMLGSIYVPYGSFESHVTTNGRVYVGGDFMMYNPTQVADFTELEGPSASIIDMDQERHNFPGGFSSMSQCSSIAWKKIDESGDPLGNTTWAVYGSLEQAKAHNTESALWQVQDNIVGPAGDLDPDNGSFKVSKLTPNRSYYIREIATNNNQYDLNTNIYQINTGAGGAIYSTIEEVYTKDGNSITNTNDTLLANTGIINKAKSTGLEWGKTNAIPDSGEPTGLPDSEWILSKKVLIGNGS